MNNPKYVVKVPFISDKKYDNYPDKSNDIIKQEINNFGFAQPCINSDSIALFIESDQCNTIKSALKYGLKEKNLHIINFHIDNIDNIKKKHQSVNAIHGDFNKIVYDINNKFDYIWLDVNNNFETYNKSIVVLFEKGLIKDTCIFGITICKRGQLYTKSQIKNDFFQLVKYYGYKLTELKEWDDEIENDVYTIFYKLVNDDNYMRIISEMDKNDFIETKKLYTYIELKEYIEWIYFLDKKKFDISKYNDAFYKLIGRRLLFSQFKFKAKQFRKRFLTLQGIKTNKINLVRRKKNINRSEKLRRSIRLGKFI